MNLINLIEKVLSHTVRCKVCDETFYERSNERNHCPYCLCSIHRDIEPHDNKSTCHGILKPFKIKGQRVTHKCNKCDTIQHHKLAKDDKTKLFESVQRSISSGYFICANAEHLGILLNVLSKYHGLLVVDGGLLELTTNASKELVQLMATLFERGIIVKYTNYKHQNTINYKTTLLSTQQFKSIFTTL